LKPSFFPLFLHSSVVLRCSVRKSCMPPNFFLPPLVRIQLLFFWGGGFFFWKNPPTQPHKKICKQKLKTKKQKQKKTKQQTKKQKKKQQTNHQKKKPKQTKKKKTLKSLITPPSSYLFEINRAAIARWTWIAPCFPSPAVAAYWFFAFEILPLQEVLCDSGSFSSE